MSDPRCDVPGGYMDDIQALQRVMGVLKSGGVPVRTVHFSGGEGDPTYAVLEASAPDQAVDDANKVLEGSGFRVRVVSALMVEEA